MVMTQLGAEFVGLNNITAMGQQPTEEELFQMISEVDEDMSGAIGEHADILIYI